MPAFGARFSTTLQRAWVFEIKGPRRVARRAWLGRFQAHRDCIVA
jgi:hypothetical protein